MKRFLGAVALACVFSVSALAGDVPTSGSPAPTGTNQTTATSRGELPTGGVASPNGETETSVITSVILTILSLLSY
jgi:hypothetical protein